MLAPQEPRFAFPAGPAAEPAAPQRQRMADDRVQSSLEHLGEPGALLWIVEIVLERIDIPRQPAFLPQVVPGVFVRGDGVRRIDAEPFRQVRDERTRILRPIAVIAAVLGDEMRLGPERDAVLPPPAAVRPARQRLAGVPLPLAEVK